MFALALAGWGTLVFLGVLQGLTEFLPVSSSGHLVLAREWLGLSGGETLAREVGLHLGTLAAVCAFCFRDLVSLTRTGSAGLWKLLIGSTLVTGVLGLLLESSIESSLNNAHSAGAGLLVTSLLLGVVAPAKSTETGLCLADGRWRHGVILGLFQTLALVPGISRAGATIVGGLVLGYARPDAVRLAFVMSIPVVAGAVLLKVLEDPAAATSMGAELAPAIGIAALVGLLALRIMTVSSDPKSLRRFAAYTAVLGIVAIATA